MRNEIKFSRFCHARSLRLAKRPPLSKREILFNHWVHLRYRRRGCKDRNQQHRQPAWAFSRDAIPEDSSRPTAALVSWSRISSLWLCCADSLDAVWLAVEGGIARHSGKSAPGRRPTRALRLPIEVPVASPASWRYSYGYDHHAGNVESAVDGSAGRVFALRSYVLYYTSGNYYACISEKKFFALCEAFTERAILLKDLKI